MVLAINPNVLAATEPPIAETKRWLDGVQFSADRPMLDLAQAVPSYPPADELMDAMADAARDPETAFYTPILGLPDLRHCLAESLSRDYFATVTADDVAITAGGNHTFMYGDHRTGGAE